MNKNTYLGEVEWDGVRDTTDTHTEYGTTGGKQWDGTGDDHLEDDTESDKEASSGDTALATCPVTDGTSDKRTNNLAGLHYRCGLERENYVRRKKSKKKNARTTERTRVDMA